MDFEQFKPVIKFLAGLFAPDHYRKNDPLNPFWAAVKLVRAADLQSWNRFKRYDEHASLTYLDYKKETQRIADIRREIRTLIKARDEIATMNTDELVEYKTEIVKVPRAWRKSIVKIKLPPPQYAETVFKASDGAKVIDGALHVETRWRNQELYVWLSCPRRVHEAEAILAKRRYLEERSPEEKAKFRDVEESWASHPVLFISHRWEALDHPDPHGRQLEKLRALKNCFLIYDYSSFPQDPSSDGLRLIFENMERLIDNVIILSSPDYVERGWCLYEYIVASFRVSVVCDEVNDPDFVQLRRWSDTHAPINLSLKGHSHESNIQNTISKGILEVVNRIRPRYVDSGFTVDTDRQLVTRLLIKTLISVLPTRKEYPSPYLGEWIDKSWKPEELSAAFTQHLDWDEMKKGWEDLDTFDLDPNELDVPATIEEAVKRNYAIERHGPMSEWDGIGRVWAGLFRSKPTHKQQGREQRTPAEG
jgi:hypothetical protein